MSNPMLHRLLGESGDVVPVLAGIPRDAFRKRTDKNRQKMHADETDTEADSVHRMVGEAEEDREDEGVIPDDAEDVDTSDRIGGKLLRQPREVVQEPSHPLADKEKFQTPYAALTAPDVTPHSTRPIDPSQVPGAPRPERFSVADFENAGSVPTHPDSEEMASKAMDVLLGRNRAPKPATQPGEFEQAGKISTEEAARMIGVQSIAEDAKARAASMLTASKDGGQGMPDPASPSDGSAVCSVFRRFTK